MNWLAVPAVVAVACLSATAADKPADRQLKVEFDELAAKATAAIETVNEMERRARSNGQSLSPGLLAQRILIQSSMDEAEEALRANKMDSLRDQFKRVRGYVDRLYQML